MLVKKGPWWQATSTCEFHIWPTARIEPVDEYGWLDHLNPSGTNRVYAVYCIYYIILLINSLSPGGFRCNFENSIFKLALLIGSFRDSFNKFIRWMIQNLTYDKSTLVQVMAWCRQATSHYLSQCWPRSLSTYASLGHNELMFSLIGCTVADICKRIEDVRKYWTFEGIFALWKTLEYLFVFCGEYFYDSNLITLNALNPNHCLYRTSMFFCLYVLIFVGICVDVCLNIFLFTTYHNRWYKWK